jgi:hypothetical protein
MYSIGIVGHGRDKFNERTELLAKDIIRDILYNAIKTYEDIVIVSGHSPVGGIDIWAEEIAMELNLLLDIKSPRQMIWDSEYGFKQRNLDIARSSDIVHVILVEKYPDNYTGQKFKLCYHCKTSDHVKSGGCWTGKKAKELGKEVIWHIIK